MNAKMPELRACFERAGFTDVRTLRSSGNVIFSSRDELEDELARCVESATTFAAIVRRQDELASIVAADPFSRWQLAEGSKRVLTFLRRPAAQPPELPLTVDKTTIFAVDDRTVFTAYVPDPRGPQFMTLIERTFGQDVTTRTWDTVRACAAAP